MSLNSALSAGTAGLLSNASALAAISDNISNVNTVAYKRANTLFDPLVKSDSSAGAYNAGGVSSFTRQLIAQQGLLASTSSATDIAVSGAGFFVVSDQPVVTGATGSFMFSRSGSFVPNANGDLVNSAGHYLQGWPVQADGSVNANPSDLSQVRVVNIGSIGGTAQASTQLKFNANLQATQTPNPDAETYSALTNNMASGALEPDFLTSVQVFDSQGSLRTVNIAFLKTDPTVTATNPNGAPNKWIMEMYVSPPGDIEAGPALDGASGQIFSGYVTFTSSGAFDPQHSDVPDSLNFGSSASGAPAGSAFKWASIAGIADQEITLDFGGPASTGGLTQLDSPSTLVSTAIDGAVFGNLAGVEIDETGFVVAKFNNGVVKRIYQLPVGTFSNPNGLKPESGGAYRVTTTSGQFTLQRPGQGGAGLIASQALETSNVDLATEFTGLITTQRAYSAASKIITTADEMLEELIRIKR